MTVAHDAATESSTWGATDPFTFSGHTPSTNVKGVAVFIYHGAVSTDLIDGAVTYGGTAMQRKQTAADTQTEAGRVYVYYLGRPPTGSQVVSINHTGSTDTKIATLVSVTGADATNIWETGIVEQNAASPQVALNTANDSALRYCVIYSGASVTTALSLASTLMSTVSDHDFGAFVGRVDRQTTASTGSFTVGYNSGTDDVALVAVAIREEPAEIGLMLGRSALIIP